MCEDTCQDINVPFFSRSSGIRQCTWLLPVPTQATRPTNLLEPPRFPRPSVTSVSHPPESAPPRMMRPQHIPNNRYTTLLDKPAPRP